MGLPADGDRGSALACGGVDSHRDGDATVTRTARWIHRRPQLIRDRRPARVRAHLDLVTFPSTGCGL